MNVGRVGCSHRVGVFFKLEAAPLRGVEDDSFEESKITLLEEAGPQKGLVQTQVLDPSPLWPPTLTRMATWTSSLETQA